jgi:hypothetical protein
VCYDHPNMPWDDTELWVADVSDSGELANQRKVLEVLASHNQRKVQARVACNIFQLAPFIACPCTCMRSQMFLCSCTVSVMTTPDAACGVAINR